MKFNIYRILAAAAVAASLASCTIDSSDRDIDTGDLHCYAEIVEYNSLPVALDETRMLLALSDKYEGKDVPEEVELTYDYQKITVKTNCRSLRSTGADWNASSEYGIEITLKASADSIWSYSRKDKYGYEAVGEITGIGTAGEETSFKVGLSGTYETVSSNGKNLESTFATDTPAVYTGSMVGSAGNISYDYNVASGKFTVKIWRAGKLHHWCTIDLSNDKCYTDLTD